MHYARLGHSIIGLKNRFIIAIGTDSGRQSNTCEIYDIVEDYWTVLPEFKLKSCSYIHKSSLLLINERYLYKFNGARATKIEMLDMSNP